MREGRYLVESVRKIRLDRIAAVVLQRNVPWCVVVHCPAGQQRLDVDLALPARTNTHRRSLDLNILLC